MNKVSLSCVVWVVIHSLYCRFHVSTLTICPGVIGIEMQYFQDGCTQEEFRCNEANSARKTSSVVKRNVTSGQNTMSHNTSKSYVQVILKVKSGEKFKEDTLCGQMWPHNTNTWQCEYFQVKCTERVKSSEKGRQGWWSSGAEKRKVVTSASSLLIFKLPRVIMQRLWTTTIRCEEAVLLCLSWKLS